MNRLWLTEQQTRSLIRALRNYIHELYKCANEAVDDGNLIASDGYIGEANILDIVLDSLEACYGKADPLRNQKLDNTDSSDNPHICTKCDHFICDDVVHMVGHCNKLGITRCAGDICI